jgi:peptidoglycan-N-acetylglucosamine deacetylase
VRMITPGMSDDEIFKPRSPKLFCLGNTKEKKIALTIDDGWKQDMELLDLLAQYKIKCTVFLIAGRGVAEKHPDWVRYLDKMGFEVCSHTLNHAYAPKMTERQFQQDIRKAQMIITNVTHKFYPFIRCSGGAFSQLNLKVAAQNGYLMVNWTNSTLDTVRGIKAPYQIKSVLNNTHNGDILLTHFGAYNTAAVLRAVIPALIERGYQFVTLSELLYGMF